MLKKYYNNIMVYNLILQYNYSNFFLLPKIEFVNLNFGLKENNINIESKIVFFFTLLFLLTNQKPYIIKLKKFNIPGCKIKLRKNNLYEFLLKFFFFLSLSFTGKNNLYTTNLTIEKFFEFPELRSEFKTFKNVNKMNINIKIYNNNSKNIQLFLKNLNLKG